MTRPTNYFVDQSGQPTKNGILIADDGSIQFVALDSQGRQIISSGGGGGNGVWGQITGSLPNQIDLATALSLKTAALGTWNLTSNVAVAPDGTNFTPASGVYPTSGANFLLCTGTGTQSLDGNAYVPNDYAVMSPALGQWVRIAGSAGAIAVTNALLKGDGVGSAIAATSGVDFAPAPAFASGVHIVFMPAGTVGANGALTVTGTAFIAGLTEFYGYYPANALSASSAAGFYWTVLSGTTAGTVYNNIYTPGSGVPVVPASPTAFSGTTGSAYVNATATYLVLAQVALGVNPMGKNGFLRQRVNLLFSAGATTHNVQTRLNASATGIQASSNGSNIAMSIIDTVQNAGRTDRQSAPNSQTGDSYSGTASPQFTSIDTSGATTWALAATLGATADWVCLLGADVSATYAA